MLARIVLALALLTSVSNAAPPRLRVTADGRHLETVDGKPFFMLADTAWELFHRLKDDEVDLYLKTRATQGFNVIYAVALPEFDLSVPDAYGNLQLQDNDPTKPNEAWFAHIDNVVKKASDLGLYIGFLPTWGDKWNKKWGKGPEIFTPENARSYGEWLGKRYADAPLIWILGGDRPVETDTHRAIIRNMAEGLRIGDGGTHLISFHPSGTKNSADFWPNEPWLSFHMFQSGHGKAKDKANYEYNLRNRALKPIKPTLDGEPRYEDHPVRGIPHEGDEWYDTFDVRQAAWWDVMSGSCGHTYGDHNIWQFLSPERPPITLARTPWKTALTHDGAIQMGYMRAFFEKMDWQKLEPRDDILAGDKGEGGSRMLAMMSPAGDNVVVYSPHGKAVEIHADKLKPELKTGLVGGSGRAVPPNVDWYNPRTNTRKPARFTSVFVGVPPTIILWAPSPRDEGRDHDGVFWLR
jgi:hypothetical protein